MVGPQSYHRLPELIARADARRRGVVDTDFRAEDKFDSRCAEPRAIRARGVTRLPHRAGRLRQVLHLLRRALYARRGSIRGRSRAIVAEARGWPTRGVREVTLLGQNVNAYHGEGPDGRTWALGAPARRARRDRRPRAAPLHHQPSARHGRRADRRASRRAALMPYLHLPVQSGSDRILEAMNRRHTRADYLASSSGSARRGPTSRSPPISSSAFRARPTPISRRRSAWSRRSATPAPSRSNTRRGPARRRRHATRSTRRSRPSGCTGCRRAIDRTAGGVQPQLRRPHARRAVRTTRPPSRPDRRPLAYLQPVQVDGAAVLIGDDRRRRRSRESAATACSARLARTARARSPAQEPELRTPGSAIPSER